MRPKSTIYAPKGDDENPRQFQWESSHPRLGAVSLFPQIKWEQCTRAGAAKPRDARNEGGSVPLSSRAISHISSLSSRAISHISSLSSRAISHAAVCVSRVLLDGQQKKERLLVVYPTSPPSSSAQTRSRVAWEQALLFGQVKRASRERASEGPYN